MAVSVNGGALEFSAVINAAQFNSAISSIERQLAGLTKTAEKEATLVDNIVRRTTSAIAGYASFIVGTNFVGDIVRVRGEFQKLEVSFRTMLGSKEAADKLLAQAVDLAAKTPFTLQDVGTGAKQLLAYGFAADEVIGTLKSLGDVSAGIGAPLTDIAYLFGTLKSQGRAFAIDVRQFAQRGIPIYAELAKVLGVSVSEVNALVEAGKVGFPEVEQVFKNMTSEGGLFFNLMQEQSKTLTGQISNLRDAWSQMLNEIGKGQEGLFTDIIQGAIYVVKNFQKVIDILKIIVITYGSYRAAIIATNIATSISTALTKGWTIAEILRYKAMQLSQRAAALLNATLLKNPIAFVVTGLAALISSLTIFSKRTSEAQRQQKLLNDIQLESQKTIVAETNSLNALLKVARDEALSKQAREAAIRKINAIAPEYLGNLTLENLKTKEGITILDNYVKALTRKSEALAISNKMEELQRQILDTQDFSENFKGPSFLKREVAKEAAKTIAELERRVDDLGQKQKKIAEEQIVNETKKQGSTQRTISVIDEEIKALKDQQSAVSTNAKQYQDFQKKITTLEEEKKRITGATKADIKASQAEENKLQALMEKRKGVLEQILDLQRSAEQSGQTKQATELDKINEKYDEVLKNITEYNKKVDEFNKKNPRANAQKIGQLDIVALNNARKKELDNQALKDEADLFIKNLEKKLQRYEQYESDKAEVGLAKAKELYGQEADAFESMLKDLKSLQLALAPKIALDIANPGEQAKFKAVSEAIDKIDAEIQQRKLDRQKQNYLDMIAATATFKVQEAAINKKYDDLEAELSKNKNLKDIQGRKEMLEQGRKEEMTALQIQIARSSALYKKLNQDILLFTRQRLKDEIKDLEKKLKVDTTLTPQQKADIQNTINQYKGLLDQTNEVAQDFAKLASQLAGVANIFGTMAGSVGKLNKELGDALQQMSDMVSVASDAANAVASFAAGDMVSGVNSAVSAISGIIEGFAKAKESKRTAQQQIRDFQNQIIAGELEYNRIIRDRQREEVKFNQLRLKGLNDEKRLLLEQKQITLATYNDVFKRLQEESFISGQSSKKKRGSILTGVLGFLSGTRTEVTDQLKSLAGKSFEEIEKLFLSGQLTENAKKLFEQLQAIKQEGVDIDRLLAENAQAMKEALTGTTSDSIADSIIEGFRSGKREISDFAGTFEELMRNALIQSLKFKYLEEPLKEFFDEFAAAAESDDALTSSEISALQDMFNTILGNANAQFEQLQQIAGINFNSSSAATNSLTGAVKGITEQQAELLAGQFGGLRLTALDILSVSRSQLTALNDISVNTSLSVVRLQSIIDKMIYYYEVRGVKMY